MLFSLLLNIINIALGNTAKKNKSVKDMLQIRNNAYVIKTRDNKIGRRYCFRHGKYSSDKVLDQYDLALIFENADAGFKTLALGGDTGVQEAINNWTLKLDCDANQIKWFGTVLQVAMGASKRK
jgi:hypothetical protein